MKSKMWILLALLLGGITSGCIGKIGKETTTTHITLSDWMGHGGPYYGGSEYRFEGNVYPVKMAVDGEFLVGNSNVSLLILNTDTDNATVSMAFLVNNEKRKPETKESSETVRGVQILRFEHDSGLNVYIWKHGNVVFRLESKDRQALDNILDIHKLFFVNEQGVYLETAIPALFSKATKFCLNRTFFKNSFRFYA